MNIKNIKNLISWNIISAIGYLSLLMTAVFLIMYSLGASGINVQADSNEYFYDYLEKYVIALYFGIYKFQILVIILLIIGSVYEKKKYLENNEPGFILFPEREKIYSILFLSGIYLNVLPLILLLITFIPVHFRLL